MIFKTSDTNIYTDKLYDIWQNRSDIYRRPKASNNEKCRDCFYLDYCDGGGVHTWDFEANVPRICMLDLIN